jgi:hypothetical protein
VKEKYGGMRAWRLGQKYVRHQILPFVLCINLIVDFANRLCARRQGRAASKHAKSG